MIGVGPERATWTFWGKAFVTIFIQGLRRSGTTILYDILSEDSNHSCFYEPLSLGKASVGGGSGAKKYNVMTSLSKARSRAGYKGGGRGEPRLNHGAPTNYRLEVGRRRLPGDVSKYLSEIVSAGDVLKFTRATFLSDELYSMDPSGVYIHIKKDPRRFVASHMCVANYGSRVCLDPELFFRKKSGFDYWSQERIVNLYIKKKKPEYLNKPAYFKLLYLWSEFGKITEADASKLFKDKYVKISTEDLYFNQKQTIKKIYNKAEISVPNNVIKWAKENVRKPRSILFENDKRWNSAFAEIGIRCEK